MSGSGGAEREARADRDAGDGTGGAGDSAASARAQRLTRADPTAPAFWCDTALVAGRAVRSVRLETDTSGRIAAVTGGVAPLGGDTQLGTVVAGMANAHSHAFHRVLRGRTNAGSGDFWGWRTRMYAAANALDPDLYRALAIGVFGEMLAAGYTAVGEFHYVHHRPDATPYTPPHAMELALAEAAHAVGIRLVLLDTLYLTGGIDSPLEAEQRRFGDGSAERWLVRWFSLRDELARYAPLVTLGAAVHSVRAVPPDALAVVARQLAPDVPLHVHVSEQPRENDECLARYGATPTRMLADAGMLSPRLSVVHATHLTDGDVALLGAAGVTVVMCPSTEADLGDGIGPARRLADSGCRIALGSDQNAVIDPFLEMRGLEAGERLASGRRGRFSPADLLTAAGPDGYASLGLGGGLAAGAWADWVEVETMSVRTIGGDIEQLALTATSADVLRVFVGGVCVAGSGSGARVSAADRAARTARSGAPDTPAHALGRAIAEIDRLIQRQHHGN
ncbi:formimidoylglutamate deiminase [Subtercola endophyticus]|uniref:formimidoylglutamate deiminase n=1 Tax=Subtercola endophyticus TaxID=2895559 RepID=UPI001E401EDF|nr:formimidoylglutamate deiminase [Subtercola endophyticus]UFS59424.1 formimidoylglutamate deiminase [Subtercola endophyticus]